MRQGWIKRWLAAGALIGMAACSQVPDYANPVEWYRGAGRWVTGEPPAAAAKTAGPTAPAADKDKPFPKLGEIPERPAPPAPAAERQQVAGALVGDRENARYTDFTVRRQIDTERAGSPAQPSGPAGVAATAARSPSAPPAPAPAATAPTPTAPTIAAAPPVNPATPAARAADRQRTEVAAVLSPRPAPPPAPAVSALPPPQPAVPAAPPPVAAVPATQPPALATVPAPAAAVPLPAAPLPAAPAPTIQAMVPTPPPPLAAATPQVAAPTSGGTPAVSVLAAVVRFADGSAALSDPDRAALERTAALHRKVGGRVHVIGHASRAPRAETSAEAQFANFSVSADRASIVAQELVRRGVPASAITIEALSDHRPSRLRPGVQPADDRRAEVYVEY